VFTSARGGYCFLACGILLESLLAGLYYLIYDFDINLTKLLAKMGMNSCIEFSLNLAKLGVEMVFKAVVSPTKENNYFPGILCAITDHLFPISL
jgi:hypothetical protein